MKRWKGQEEKDRRNKINRGGRGEK